jgi:hypothetical protein
MAKGKKRKSHQRINTNNASASKNNGQDKYKKEKYKEAKSLMFRNPYLWLTPLCGLYFLKEYNPAFAWFGALGALGFYKNSNPLFRKLFYLSFLSILGIAGLLIR